MTMSRKFKRQMSVMMAFGAPILLVKVTTMMTGDSWLQWARGTTDTGAFAIPNFTPTKAPEWSSAQRASEARILALGSSSFGPSPMYYSPKEEPSDEREPEVIPEPVGPRVFTVSVKVVMGSPQGATALINNQMCRVGDLIHGSDWRIVAMDAELRTVSVRHDHTGKEVTHTVDIDSLNH